MLPFETHLLDIWAKRGLKLSESGDFELFWRGFTRQAGFNRMGKSPEEPRAAGLGASRSAHRGDLPDAELRQHPRQGALGGRRLQTTMPTWTRCSTCIRGVGPCSWSGIQERFSLRGSSSIGGGR